MASVLKQIINFFSTAGPTTNGPIPKPVHLVLQMSIVLHNGSLQHWLIQHHHQPFLYSSNNNFEHFLQAFITLAKPEKNFSPFKFWILINSSKLAPPQKALLPSDLRIITFRLLHLLNLWNRKFFLANYLVRIERVIKFIVPTPFSLSQMYALLFSFISLFKCKNNQLFFVSIYSEN